MTKTVFNIAEQFSPFPAGRFDTTSDFNGSAFKAVVKKLLSEFEVVEFVLDGAEGYPSSFLEEAFGGLVRDGFKPKDLENRLFFTFKAPRYAVYPALIRRYIKDADR